METKRSKLSDRQLLEQYLQGPSTPQGFEAKEELQFRNYLAFMRYNRWLIVLTSVLALAGLADLVLKMMAGPSAP